MCIRDSYAVDGETVHSVSFDSLHELNDHFASLYFDAMISDAEYYYYELHPNEKMCIRDSYLVVSSYIGMPEWKLTKNTLNKICGTAYAVEKAWKELLAAGYLKHYTARAASGAFIHRDVYKRQLLLPAVSTRLITSSETSGVFHSNTSEVGAAVCVFDWNTLLLSSISDICSKATAAGFSGSAAVWLFSK